MNTQVIFIELPIPRKNRYICDITEKLFEEGKAVHIYASQKENALQLSRDLWSWKPDSFIPHSVYFGSEQEPTADEPVVIATKLPASPADVIILHDPLPAEQTKDYTMVIDFAEIYEKQKHIQSRQRFKTFRDTQGFEVKFTKIGAFLQQERIVD
ncbi:hypothetical protein DRI50_00210 [candidate division KSB1 bacterium]|nr:MAG: hypothetical protein DRI50_00210 [candidate division KSB1 bacterium]